VFSEEYRVCVEHLRLAVSESGLTQKVIAERLQRPTPYLSKVLNGRQFATLVEMRAICIAAGIPFLEWVKTLDDALAEQHQSITNI
jgi:transcriptional regulator with XRE-family HTH domain